MLEARSAEGTKWALVTEPLTWDDNKCCALHSSHKTKKGVKDHSVSKQTRNPGSLQLNTIKSLICVMWVKVGNSLAILVRVQSQSGLFELLEGGGGREKEEGGGGKR